MGSTCIFTDLPSLNHKPCQVRSKDFLLTKEGGIARKRYTADEIIGHLRTIEIEMGKGLVVVDACRKLGFTEQTYYRWKKNAAGCVSTRPNG
jgi:putative transposase